MTARPTGRFPNSQRIRQHAEYQRIQRRGRRVRTRHFVFAISASDCAEPRLGITASRRVGNAVTRNRIKRVVREAFRATRELWPPGFDVVVIVRWAEPGLGLDAVVAEWRAAASQIAKRAAEARLDVSAERHEG